MARASLDELLLDFEDFLRQRSLRQWGKDDAEARRVREVGFRRDRTDRTEQSDQRRLYSQWLDHRDPAVVANAVICLINQANYLLDQQIAGLEREFISEGGYTEQLAAARLEERRRQSGSRVQSDRTDRSDQTEQSPDCPACGKDMSKKRLTCPI